MSFGDSFDMEAQQANSDPGRSWGGVMSEAWDNLGPSAKKAAEDFVELVAHPLDAAEGMYHVFAGAVQKLVPGRQGDEQYAEAVWNHMAKRYGGVENFKNALAKDPAGIAVEVLTMTAGGAATGKLAAAVGRKMAARAKAAEALKWGTAVHKFEACVKRPVETIILDPKSKMQMLVAKKAGIVFEDGKTGKLMIRSQEGATELKDGCRIAVDKTKDGPACGYNIKESALASKYVKTDSPCGIVYESNANRSFAVSIDQLEGAGGDVRRITAYMKNLDIEARMPDGTKAVMKQLSQNANGMWQMVAPWGERFDVRKGSQMLIDNHEEILRALNEGKKPPVPDVRPVKGDVFAETYRPAGAADASGKVPLNGKDLDILELYAETLAKHPESAEAGAFMARRSAATRQAASSPITRLAEKAAGIGEAAQDKVSSIFMKGAPAAGGIAMAAVGGRATAAHAAPGTEAATPLEDPFAGCGLEMQPSKPLFTMPEENGPAAQAQAVTQTF